MEDRAVNDPAVDDAVAAPVVPAAETAAHGLTAWLRGRFTAWAQSEPSTWAERDPSRWMHRDPVF